MKRALALSLLVAAIFALGMGKKPQGTVLWSGVVKDAAFESFEILEIEGKKELHLTRGKDTCRFPLGTFNEKEGKAWFDGARMGGCKVADVLRASGDVSEKGGSVRLLGGKDPIDLVIVDVTKAK